MWFLLPTRDFLSMFCLATQNFKFINHQKVLFILSTGFLILENSGGFFVSNMYCASFVYSYSLNQSHLKVQVSLWTRRCSLNRASPLLSPFPFATRTPINYLAMQKSRLSLLYSSIIKWATLVYLNTVIRWTRLTRKKSKWVDSLYLYDNMHIYACTWKDTT